MLALDIETLGLLNEKPLPAITCVCLYDGTQHYALEFYGIHVSQETKMENKDTLIRLLDSAKCIVGFNVVLFDLEYIKCFFEISQSKLTSWIEKTVDPFLCMKYVLGTTCTLQQLLLMNHLPSKSGSGTEAIHWAKEGKMHLVVEYCMMDTKLIYMACSLPVIRLSESWIAEITTSFSRMMLSFKRIQDVSSLQQILCKNAQEETMYFADHMAAKGLVVFTSSTTLPSLMEK